MLLIYQQKVCAAEILSEVEQHQAALIHHGTYSHPHFFPWGSDELGQFVIQLRGGRERYREQCITKQM